jgi:hypothetical protein
MKFDPERWLNEPRLKWCSRAARSLWIDMIAKMHAATPRGHFVIDGIVPTTAQIAALFGDAENDVAAWLAELEAQGVFSKTPEGVIFSRGMVRDTVELVASQAAGKQGGAPAHRPADIAPLDAAADAAMKRMKAAERARRAREKKKAVTLTVTPVTPPERDASVTRNVTERDASRCDERDATTTTSSAPKAAGASRVTRHGVHPKIEDKKKIDSSLTEAVSPRLADRPSRLEGGRSAKATPTTVLAPSEIPPDKVAKAERVMAQLRRVRETEEAGKVHDPPAPPAPDLATLQPEPGSLPQ